MKIILLQDVNKVGKKFDIKEVNNGYAVNFLFPKKLAKIATNEAIKEIETIKKGYQDKLVKENLELAEVIKKIKDSALEITANTNEEGKLFAGIGEKEIANLIREKTTQEINPNLIELEHPIKELGEHKFKIDIDGKKVELTLNVRK